MAADVSENPEDEAVEGGVEDGRGEGRDREAVFWLMHSDQVGTEKIRPWPWDDRKVSTERFLHVHCHETNKTIFCHFFYLLKYVLNLKSFYYINLYV